MLYAHPRIAPPETRFLLPAYAARGDLGDLRVVANRRAPARWITARGQTRFADLGWTPTTSPTSANTRRPGRLGRHWATGGAVRTVNLSMMGFDPVRFQIEPPARYRAPGDAPDTTELTPAGDDERVIRS